MKNKFNIGDRVRITHTSLEGSIGYIKESTGEDFDPSYTLYIPELNRKTIRYGSELELVDENGNAIFEESADSDNNTIEIEDTSLDMKLFLCSNDGSIPHLHFKKTEEDGSITEGCICLTYPLYYKHSQHSGRPSREEFSQLLEFFHEDYVWDHIINQWNKNNTVQINEDCTIPEYYYGMMTTYEGDTTLERIKDLYQ